MIMASLYTHATRGGTWTRISEETVREGTCTDCGWHCNIEKEVYQEQTTGEVVTLAQRYCYCFPPTFAQIEAEKEATPVVREEAVEEVPDWRDWRDPYIYGYTGASK